MTLLRARARIALSRLALVIAFVATSAHAQMSEGEKKAAARAAYMEGVQLQDGGKPAEALSRFEAAQKLYDAPTHLLHIAECQALTGKLVEASETYETLTRKTLPPGSPDVFVQAQEQAKAELPPLRARIPTMKVNVKPDPRSLRNLQITLNDRQMPAELVGIARPVNPGPYRISAVAQGYATPAPTDLEIKEKEQKVVELTLQPAASPTVYPVVVPPPAPYTGGQPPPGGTPPPPPYEQRPTEPKPQGPSSYGLLFGPRIAYFIPSGNLAAGRRMADAVGNGPLLGVDFMGRVAKILLLGGALEWASLSEPRNYQEQPALGGSTRTLKASTVYAGVFIGLVANVDKVSFIGDLGLGYRTMSRELSATNGFFRDESFGGAEGSLGLGINVPAGPIRIVPKITFGVGSFKQNKNECRPAASCNFGTGGITFGTGTTTVNDNSTHTNVAFQLALYWHADLGKKAAAAAAPGAAPAAAPGPAPAPGDQPIQ